MIVAAWAVIGIGSPTAGGRAADPSQVPPTDAGATRDRLTEVAHSDRLVWTGVVLAPDGRVLVVLPQAAGNPGPFLATLDAGGEPTAYPYHAKADPAPTDPAHALVAPVALRLASDNSLWVVDSGVPGSGKSPIPGAAKLVRIDLAHDAVTRSYVLPPEVLQPKSAIGEMRFNGSHAYIADAGAPGLIVLDLTRGSARRLLDPDPSTTGQRPVTVDGETLKGADGKPAMIDVSTLEVTPDGKYLYYQPLPGPMFRVSTALLDDAKASPRSVAAGVEFWYDTPALGGSAIAADGTLYLDDVEHDSVLALTPDRVLTTIIRDPRLHWAAAPFLKDATLTLPVAQLDRTAAFHHGKSVVQFPVELFSLHLATPAAEAAPH